jgi:hypothetical protein
VSETGPRIVPTQYFKGSRYSTSAFEIVLGQYLATLTACLPARIAEATANVGDEPPPIGR